MRMVRATMPEVLGQDYVRTARAKGVKRKVVTAACAPERSSRWSRSSASSRDPDGRLGVVEIIFGLPGVGNTLINAIFNRDYRSCRPRR
jgi:ABC-type dipeptide/oligopeptide/nickel transport system permease component